MRKKARLDYGMVSKEMGSKKVNCIKTVTLYMIMDFNEHSANNYSNLIQVCIKPNERPEVRK
jgi:hypothetical protein